MDVVVAPDSFGGTLSAPDAASAIAACFPAARVVPMSDGGPGFVEVLAAALPDAVVRTSEVEGPSGTPVTASWLLDRRSGTAWVESAQACGLHLLAAPDPEGATTRGVGQLVAAAAREAATVVVGLGGSGTTDGGRGFLETYDGTADLVLASDVDTPLLGPHGAAAVFGPQKGATPDQVARLEARLAAQAGDRPEKDLPGAGAAGGLGFALLTLGATRVSGAAVCADAAGLDAAIAGADLVVTGEGRYDHTSLRGKVVAEVARRCVEHAVPCVVVAGSVEVGAREASAHGVAETWDLTALCGPAARTDAWSSLEAVARRVAAQWLR